MDRNARGLAPAIALAAVFAAASAAAGIVKLVPSGAEVIQEFGSSVALDGDRAAVASESLAGPGIVYLFERNAGGPGAWGEVAKVRADDIEADFGIAVVALQGDRLVVGTPRDDEVRGNAGAVFVFERDSGAAGHWDQVVKIIAADGGESEQFGSSVSLDGDTLAVGAIGVRNHLDFGAVYLFARDAGGPGAWGQIAKLSLVDAKLYDTFGNAVALEGGTLFVGARGRDVLDVDSGAVYVYERDAGGPDAWGLVAELTGGGGAGASFGHRTVLDGDRVLVTERFGDVAYLFERAPGDPYLWQLAATLTDPLAGASFGEGAALRGDLAVVGSGQSNLLRGSAAVFARDAGGPGAWSMQSRLTAPDGASGDRLGDAVALAGQTVLVGSPGDGEGSAYVYDLEDLGPLITLSGECPGTVRLDLSLAAPDSRIAIAGSFATGDSVVPRGPCAGTELGLDSPVPLGPATADALGNLSLTVDLGTGPCGAYLQAVDTLRCRPSNVHRLPGDPDTLVRYDPGAPADFFRPPDHSGLVQDWVGNVFDTAGGSPLGSGHLSAVQVYLQRGNCAGQSATLAALPLPASHRDTVTALTTVQVPLVDRTFAHVELVYPPLVPPSFMVAHLLHFPDYYDGCLGSSGGSLGMHYGTVLGQGHHGAEMAALDGGRGNLFERLDANAMIRVAGSFRRNLLPVELMNLRLEVKRKDVEDGNGGPD